MKIAFDRLTPREFWVLRNMARGKATKVMAMELRRSERTIEQYRTSLLAKTGALNSAHLCAEAVRHGII